MAIKFRKLPTPIYMDEEAPSEFKKSILLIGYPNSNWYNEALEYLKSVEFDDSYVFISECIDGDIPLYKQVQWIEKYMGSTDAIVFWDQIGSDKPDLLYDFEKYTLTENFFYGIPKTKYYGPNANKYILENQFLETKYIESLTESTFTNRDVPSEPYRSLEDLLDEAIAFVGEGKVSSPNTSSIPIVQSSSSPVVVVKSHEDISEKVFILSGGFNNLCENITQRNTQISGLIIRHRDEINDEFKRTSEEFGSVTDKITEQVTSTDNILSANICKLSENLTTNVDGINTEISNIDSRVDTNKQKNTSNRKNIVENRKNVQSNKSDITTNNKDITLIKDNVSSIEEQLVEVSNNIDGNTEKVDTEVSKLNNKIDKKITKRIDTTADDLKKTRTVVEDIRKNISKDSINTYKKINNLDDKIRTTNKTSVNKIKSEIYDLKEELENEIVSESDKQSKDLKISIDKINTNVSNNTDEIENINTALQNTENDVRKTNAEIQRLGNKIQYHQNEYTGGGGTEQIGTRFRDTKFEVYKDGEDTAKLKFNLQSLDPSEIIQIYANPSQDGDINLILPEISGTFALTSDIPTSGHIIQDEGVDLSQRDRLNFIGQGVSVTDSVSSTDVEVLGSSIIAFDWYHDTVVTSSPEPTSGSFKFNNSDYSSVTEIYLSVYEKDGLNVSTILENLILGNSIVFQSSTVAENSVLYQINGDVTSTSASVTLPVVYNSSNGSNFTSDEVCIGTLFCCGNSATGSDKEVQFNFNGELSAKVGFEYDYTTDILLAPTVQIGLSGTLIDTIANYDIDSPLEVVDTIDVNSGNAAFWNYLLNDGTNFRAGRIMSCWDGSSLQFNEVTTNDIGNTSGVTFSATLSGSDVLLVAFTNSDNWTVKAKRELL